MKRCLNVLIPVMVMIFILQPFEIKAENGEAVFESMRCGICHKIKEGKSNPPLTEISKAYNGDRIKLASYLRGEIEPIVNKERAGVMKSSIEKTKNLSQEDIKALVDYILNQADQ